LKQPTRHIAIGDIHGHAAALEALLKQIAPTSHDLIITLGDHVDGGPDSRGVLEQLIALKSQCELVSLLGNHEETMLWARRSGIDFRMWQECGGDTTLASYGKTRSLESVPWEHWRFLQDCVFHFETETHFFVHARYEPAIPLDEQNTKTLLWLSLDESIPPPHQNGKVAVVGHTVQPEGKVLNLPHLKCLDTGCGHRGRLTAMELKSGQLWQVTEAGNVVAAACQLPK
jgi:serine/threonine protein phosphatase 1